MYHMNLGSRFPLVDWKLSVQIFRDFEETMYYINCAYVEWSFSPLINCVKNSRDACPTSREPYPYDGTS